MIEATAGAIEPAERPVDSKPRAEEPFDGREIEQRSLDQIRLGVERFGSVREQHLHRRRLRSCEEQPDFLEVVLERGPQLGCGTVHADDAGELVDHEDQRLMRRCLDEDVEL